MAALASDWLRHFRRLLWNRWTKFNETWPEARSQHPLQSLCFSGWSEKQDGRPGLWFAETFSTSPLKPLNGIHRNLTGSKILTSSTMFVFSGRSEKQDDRTGLRLADTFSTSPLKPLNGRNSMKLDRKQDLNVFYQVCGFFWPIGKTRLLPWPHLPKARVESCSAATTLSSYVKNFLGWLTLFRLHWGRPIRDVAYTVTYILTPWMIKADLVWKGKQNNVNWICF